MDKFIQELKIFVSADDPVLEYWDRCNQSQRLCWNLYRGFYPRETEMSKQKGEVRRHKFSCQRRKGQSQRQASTLWLSRTSAPAKNSFSPFLQRGKRVIVLYKLWCLYLVSIILTYMYRYWIPDQYVCICILYVYTYMDTYRYILYAQWCTYLVHTKGKIMYSKEYAQTCTYSYVFCTYICTTIRTHTFYMHSGVRILYVWYVHIRTIWNMFRPVHIHMYFVRIILTRYVRIRLICAIMYVSCTYNTYIHVQYWICTIHTN